MNIKTLLRRLVRWLGLLPDEGIHYIGGSDTLPPPLTREEEAALLERLEALYQQHGYYKEALDSFTLPGSDGQQRIAAIMADLRQNQPAELGGQAIAQVKDYQEGLDGLPKANVLKYFFAEGGWMAVRPSGTEPKIKFYYSLKGSSMEEAAKRVAALQQAVKAYLFSE